MGTSAKHLLLFSIFILAQWLVHSAHAAGAGRVVVEQSSVDVKSPKSVTVAWDTNLPTSYEVRVLRKGKTLQ